MASQGLKVLTLRHASDLPQGATTGGSVGRKRRHRPKTEGRRRTQRKWRGLGIGIRYSFLPAQERGSLYRLSAEQDCFAQSVPLAFSTEVGFVCTCMGRGGGSEEMRPLV